MRTPKEYTVNIKKGVVTEEMLGMALYSYNKRAKNMRDKRNEYRRNRWYSYHDNAETAEKRMEHYYECKDELISYLSPIAIHLVERNRRTRVYSYEKEYRKIDWDDVIYTNSYWDYDRDKEIDFKDILVPFTETYLYYKIGGFTFHHPIEEISEEYKDLPVEEIGDLSTYGRDISDLLSVQMADKIRNGLANGTLSLIFNNE